MMTLYTIIEAIAAVVAGIMIAVCTKMADGVVYRRLDRIGRITNILLIPIYVILSPICLFLGIIAHPGYGGFLGVLGGIVAVIVASALLFCGLGLGFSVALRKWGKSRLSFAAQFAGMAGILLSVLLFVVFYDNLLGSIN